MTLQYLSVLGRHIVYLYDNTYARTSFSLVDFHDADTLADTHAYSY